MGLNQYICVLMTGKNKKAKKSVYGGKAPKTNVRAGGRTRKVNPTNSKKKYPKL